MKFSEFVIGCFGDPLRYFFFRLHGILDEAARDVQRRIISCSSWVLSRGTGCNRCGTSTSTSARVPFCCYLARGSTTGVFVRETPSYDGRISVRFKRSAYQGCNHDPFARPSTCRPRCVFNEKMTANAFQDVGSLAEPYEEVRTAHSHMLNIADALVTSPKAIASPRTPLSSSMF